ncbi:hypothetical protein FZEAL_3077 [Fusarium zealandicum]|uniref:Acetyltransferase n=1 Tax=Fusarium zealandicum TaxID=1053134 RepID=A0A8H4XMW8_9HYPO|nr:hypothetical protein FZEAL_3077 [Fusarium zealandicum]
MAILGKILLTLDALGMVIGAPIADMNETHQYNPRWPPHAKFHNGQTISLAIMLGLLTLYYTWRPATGISSKDSRTMAMVCGTIYWISGLCAQFFPEASGLDPEFGGPGFPQAKLFLGFLGCGIAGWLCERRGL